ncbi:hypothetical protein BDK51DRAFT_47938 [Blyttiomyces helicus]|uniref:EGF-like domain-containing protein n=1 Tax=Blyttiomyces helicus TaxID=388810 RepID=A0A4P9W790_9FUNG|nr:hypothetical protein BDK51DRAFT_47938 [Blyttiomyces helicus]|eukprot:RKO88329.1 hypothetical protein BDK51DRAFT_47938 [Blyttiomyces helicus]
MLWIHYRKDILDLYNLTAPRSWDDYERIGRLLNGTDMNGDGIPDYGSCIPKNTSVGPGYFLWAFYASYVQTQGTAQGAFFDTKTFDPLVLNEGFYAALKFYNETSEYSAANWSERRGGGWAVQERINSSAGGSKLYTTKGVDRVLNRSSGLLVPCDSDICPYAVDGRNYAPYSAVGGWSTAINIWSPPERKEAAYQFLAWMNAPSESDMDVARGEGIDMFRLSQLTTGFWASQGIPPEASRSFLPAEKAVLDSPNIVMDMRVHQNHVYQMEILPEFLEATWNGSMSYMNAASDLTNRIGERVQHQTYLRSIGAPPLSEFDCDALSDCSQNGVCVADGICNCVTGWYGDDCSLFGTRFTASPPGVAVGVLLLIESLLAALSRNAVFSVCGAVFVVTISTYVLLLRLNPAADRDIVVQFGIKLLALFTDCNFLVNLIFIEPPFDPLYTYVAVASLSTSLVFNFALAVIVLERERGHPQMKLWLENNHTTAAAVLLFSSIGVELLRIIESRIMDIPAFRAPLSRKASWRLRYWGVIELPMQVAPQLAIQIKVLEAYGFLSIPFTALVVNILMLFLCISKLVLLGMLLIRERSESLSRTSDRSSRHRLHLVTDGDDGSNTVPSERGSKVALGTSTTIADRTLRVAEETDIDFSDMACVRPPRLCFGGAQIIAQGARDSECGGVAHSLPDGIAFPLLQSFDPCGTPCGLPVALAAVAAEAGRRLERGDIVTTNYLLRIMSVVGDSQQLWSAFERSHTNVTLSKLLCGDWMLVEPDVDSWRGIP